MKYLVFVLLLVCTCSFCRGASTTVEKKETTARVFELRSTLPLNIPPVSNDIIIASDEATHAPAIEVSGAALAFVISFLRLSSNSVDFAPRDGICRSTKFYKILFRSIIAPNAP